MSEPNPVNGPRWVEFDQRADRGWRIDGGFDLDLYWITAQRRSLMPGGPQIQIAVNTPDPAICCDAALEAMDRIDGVR